jgi:large subunit ribosomal protein L6
MSRVGNKPIQIPSGVEVKADGTSFNVKGKLGQLSCTIPASISYELNDGTISFNFSRSGEKPQDRADHGLARALVNNLVVGVSEGFKKSLEIFGTGYKWELRGKAIVLNVGYSHQVEIPVPDGIDVEIKGSNLTVSGADKHMVGFIAAQVKKAKPVEPYKGKGIKYAGEYVRRKAGKAGA